MSVLATLRARLRALLRGQTAVEPTDAAHEAAPRHDRREAGRERHQETGEPAWDAVDRIEDPPGSGRKDPDAATEILGGD
jgi:hypothetical protein